MIDWLNHREIPVHLFSNEVLTTEGFTNSVMARALAQGRAIEQYQRVGVLLTQFNDMVEPLTTLGWKRLYDNYEESRGNRTVVYLHADGMIRLHGGSSHAYLTVIALDPDLRKKTGELFDTWVSAKPPRGQVYVLGTKGPKLELMPLGVTNAKLIRSNYSTTAVEYFDRAVAEIQAATPNGRLTIIDGPPGTGKSYYVRGLIEALPGTTFVLIPADMVRELGQPAFVPTLASHQNDGPLVLILEDADETLVKRMGDNIASIAALLNFADGMLGELLDLRIIATSNARKIELEPAMMRPGRLSQHIHIGPLSTTEAEEALKGLVPGHTEPSGFAGETALADVYRRARELGWQSPPTPKPAGGRGRMGFRFDPEDF